MGSLNTVSASSRIKKVSIERTLIRANGNTWPEDHVHAFNKAHGGSCQCGASCEVLETLTSERGFKGWIVNTFKQLGRKLAQ